MSKDFLANFFQSQKTLYASASSPLVLVGIGTHNSLYNEHGNGFLFQNEKRLFNPQYTKIIYLIDKLYKYPHSTRLLITYLSEHYHLDLDLIDSSSELDYYCNNNFHVYYLKVNLPTSYPKQIRLLPTQLSQIEHIDPKIYHYIEGFKPEQFEYPRWSLAIASRCIYQLPLYSRLHDLIQMYLNLNGTVHVLNAAIFTTRNLNPQIVEKDGKISIITSSSFLAGNKYFDLFPEIVYIFYDLNASYPNKSLTLQSDDIYL